MNQITRLPIVVIAIFTFNGCVSHSIQNYDVAGMPTMPQVHINTIKEDSQKIYFSGSISSSFEKQMAGNIPGHTKVNQKGVFEGDTKNGYITEHPGVNVYPFTGNNFQWQLPYFSLDLGMDARLKERTYITMRINLSMNDSTTNFGLGAGYASESIGKNFGLRSEAGLSIQELSIYAITYKTQLGHPDIYEFHTYNENAFHLGIYTALTIFTAYKDEKINYFIQGSFQWQGLQDFEPIHIYGYQEPPGGTFYFSLTPGVLIDISKESKIVSGVHIMKDFQIDNPNTNFIFFPFVQIDYSF